MSDLKSHNLLPANLSITIEQYHHTIGTLCDWLNNETYNHARLNENLCRLIAGEPPMRDASEVVWELFRQLQELRAYKAQELR